MCASLPWQGVHATVWDSRPFVLNVSTAGGQSDIGSADRQRLNLAFCLFRFYFFNTTPASFWFSILAFVISTSHSIVLTLLALA